MYAPFPDPGSDPGGVAASSPARTLRAGGVCAEVHRTTVYRTNHQSDWAVTLHPSWEEVRSTVGHFSSVSQFVVAETLGRR